MENQKMWAERHHADAVQDLGKKEEYINHVSVQLEEYKTQTLSLERDIRECRSNLHKLKEENETLEARCEKLEEENRESKRLHRDLQIKSSCMEQKIQNYEKDTHAWKTERESLQRQLEEAREVLDTKENSWQTSLSQKSANLMERDISLRRDEDTIKELRKEKANVEQELQFTQKHFRDACQRLENESGKATVLENEKRRLEQDIEMLQSSIREKKRKIAELEEEKHKLTNNATQLTQKINDLKKEKSTLIEENDEKKAECTQLKGNMIQMEKQYSQLVERNKSQIADMEKQKGHLASHLEEKTNLYEATRQELEEEKQVVKSQGEEIESLRKTQETLLEAEQQHRAKINELLGTNAALQGKNQQMETYYKNETEDVQRELLRKVEEITDLQEDIEEHKKTNTTARAMIGQLQEAIEEQKDELRGKEKLIEDLCSQRERENQILFPHGQPKISDKNPVVGPEILQQNVTKEDGKEYISSFEWVAHADEATGKSWITNPSQQKHECDLAKPHTYEDGDKTRHLPHASTSSSEQVADGNIQLFAVGGRGIKDKDKKTIKVLNNDKQWEDIFNLPHESRFNQSRACVCPEGIVITGGIAPNSKNPCAHAYLYSFGRKSWNELPSMKNIRHTHATVYHDGEIYVLGGKSISWTISTAEKLNLASQHRVWTKLQDMLMPIHSHTAVPYKSKLFVVGGRKTILSQREQVNSSLLVYNTKKSRWSNIRKDMPASCQNCAAVVVNDCIYVLSALEPKPMKYDITEDTWTILDPRENSTLYGGGLAAAFHDKILLLGGKDTRGKQHTDVSVFDPVSETCTKAGFTLFSTMLDFTVVYLHRPT